MLKKRLLQKLNKYLYYRTTLSQSEKEKIIQTFLSQYPPCINPSLKKTHSSLGKFSYEDFLESEFSGFLEKHFYNFTPHLEIPWSVFSQIFINPPISLLKLFSIYQKKHNLELSVEIQKLEKEIKKMYHFQNKKKFNFPINWYPHSKIEIKDLAEYWATNIFSKLLQEQYAPPSAKGFWQAQLEKLTTNR